MSDLNIALSIVFLSQVMLISFFFPRMLLRHLGHVVENYPPAQYPRLYPVSIDRIARARRLYRTMNAVVLLVGLALVFAGLYWPTREMLNWDSSSVLTLFFALQYSPLLVGMGAGFLYFFLMRKNDKRTQRRAALQRRRVTDFVSPATLGLTLGVYAAFALLVVYVRQFDYPWFGGYWNMVGVTVLNLFFAGLGYWNLYGKKRDPYQAQDDRNREIEFTFRVFCWVSIIGTAFVALSIGIRALALHDYIPIATSLYLQTIALFSFRAFRLKGINFEVYRDEPSMT